MTAEKKMTFLYKKYKWFPYVNKIDLHIPNIPNFTSLQVNNFGRVDRLPNKLKFYSRAISLIGSFPRYFRWKQKSRRHIEKRL